MIIKDIYTKIEDNYNKKLYLCIKINQTCLKFFEENVFLNFSVCQSKNRNSSKGIVQNFLLNRVTHFYSPIVDTFFITIIKYIFFFVYPSN